MTGAGTPGTGIVLKLILVLVQCSLRHSLNEHLLPTTLLAVLRWSNGCSFDHSPLEVGCSNSLDWFQRCQRSAV